MEKAIVVLCLVMVLAEARYKPARVDGDLRPGEYSKVLCTSDFKRERDSIMNKARCGEPKEVFTLLKPNASHETITPSAAWVKKCVGICEFDNQGTCTATATKIRHIPVRIYNTETNKESCATYAVEEHLSCGCCPLGPDHCISPRVFNPRKCSCHCPNIEDRRECIKKTNMTWNRARCVCEPS